MSHKPTRAELQAYLDSPYQPPVAEPVHPTNNVHLFTDLAWQTEEEPPFPSNPHHPQLYHLLTVTQQTLIGYYPHDTHTLGAPDAHYIAWAPLSNNTTTTSNSTTSKLLWN